MKNVKLLSQIILREGIAHIEDLPLREFIRTVESMKDKIITEKLDGANLWFGIDDKGLYTSREGKSSRKTRFYKISDYPVVAAYNGFRGAHLAIEKAESIIRKYLKEGDSVEIEVLFGRQPNTVTYGVEGKNFIVVIRGVNNTPDDRVQNLANALNNKQYKVTSVVVSSPDGDKLENSNEEMLWEFTKVEPIVGDKIKTEAVTKILDDLRAFAAQQNKLFPELTNGDISELNLTSVSKDKRSLAKTERDRVNEYIMNEFKEPIKEQLLNKFVRKIKPMLQDPKLHPSEDVGVEGVVLRDPITGSQTKIVDKDVFTAINSFNSAVRANISGLVRTTDQDAPIELRGGAFGQAKIRIANLLGSQELALSSTAKRFISKFKKSDASSTSLALAQNLNIKSLSSVRTKISAILKNTLEEVNGILNEFKQEAGEFKLQLKTGKEIGISPEVMKRTLTAFAETKKEINEINSKVLASRSPADLVLALYGRTINSLFSEGDSEVNESYNLIKSINEDDGIATTAGAIAPVEKRLFQGSKVIVKRPRNFTRPKKFPIPTIPENYSLIKSVNENWAHASDMKFATDVDDSAQAANDVEFKQLRNNVNMGDQLTQMDVSRYLDKAHDINNEVDTIAFGLETDNDKIVKVYVNAAQANDFEKAMSELLGQEDDIEKAINDLAIRFDIVDVEWPQDINAPVQSTDDSSIVDGDVETASDDETEENPDVDLSIFGDEGPAEDETPSDENTDQNNEQDSEEQNASGDEEENKGNEEDLEDEDTSDEEESEERNDFGEIVKKKKTKKKKEKAEEENEDEEENTEESLVVIGKLLNEMAVREAAGQSVSFATPALQAISDMLVAMGFDLTATRSFVVQANTLQSRNTPGLVAAKHSAISTKIAAARDALEKALSLSSTTPNTQPAPTQQNQGYELIGSILESEDQWMAANLKALGVQIFTTGLIIKLSDEESSNLRNAFDEHKSILVSSTNGKQFNFDAASNGGYVVHEKDKETSAKEMTADDVSKIVKVLSSK